MGSLILGKYSYLKTIILVIAILVAVAGGQEFRYSKIYPVPDLSFYPSVLTGLDILQQMDFEPLQGKRIAILCNQTAVNHNGEHLLDFINSQWDITVKTIFTPEHGLFGRQNEDVRLSGKDDTDPVTGARIINLFGRYVIPPKWTLTDVDVILVDIVDPGVRYFTFVTTITKMMETASRLEIPVIVLDRPNPIRGDIMNGPVVRTAYQSFVGYHLVPIRHGLTVGEYALMINEMGWVKNLARVDLTIIPMVNWQRDMWYDQTGLPWVPPSPGFDTLITNLVYTGTALIEGTNLSVGKGTDKPFYRVGAPWIAGLHLYQVLERQKLPGVNFKAVSFTPHQTHSSAEIPAYLDQTCNGVEIEIKDRETFDPLLTAITIIILTEQLYPRQFSWNGDYIDKLFGYDLLRTFVAQKKQPEYLPGRWAHDVIRFSEFRKRFLLY